MAEISNTNGNQTAALDINHDHSDHICCCPCMAGKNPSSGCLETTGSIQKLMGELLGTYLLLIAGFAAMVVNKDMGLFGIATLWGLDVMVMIYTVGHISGAHFNPAVTIAFATSKRFAWKHVPAYVSAQVLGSTLATGTVKLLFKEEKLQILGTIPAGSDLQSLGLEFLITFYLMFAVSGIATDNRAVGELAGVVIGAVITINSIVAGPISGASMNPARSLGPAIISNSYKGLWIYILGPTAGAVTGVWFYNAIRFKTKPWEEVIKSKNFLRRSAQSKL